MSIFEVKNFSEYLRIYVKSLPQKGRGVLSSISLATGIHSTTLSQAVKGDRPFSLEQVASICIYLGLNELETRYALVLLQAERAGTEVLKCIFANELGRLKQQALELVHVVKKDKVLSEEERALFYSNWYYSALAVLSSIPGLNNSSALSSRLGLSIQKTNQVIGFLVGSGVCTDRNGEIKPGSNSTHLEAHSPLVSRHHGNWRIKAMEKHPNLDHQFEMAYSSPMSLSKQDGIQIRQLIVDLVKKVNEMREPSPSEDAYFLNIDWIKI